MSDNFEQSEDQAELSVANLQALVEYYRNRASQLEFEFLQYQLASQATVQKLLGELQEHTQAHSAADQDSTK